MKSEVTASLITGVLAGMNGLLAFLILHALWITPIWFILPLGLVIAGVGGLVVGWSYAEILHRLPKRPWTSIAFAALIATILTPAFILAELRSPMFAVTAAGVTNLAMGLPEFVLRFTVELLVTATIAGGISGWWLGRTRRAVLATALAGLVFALGPGHNIPFIGGTMGVGKEIAIMGIVIVISSLVLVEGHFYLGKNWAGKTGLEERSSN